ncbi:uncharacterized protein K452DRAFT_6401 [Aplosporella prunicola CBS 121167]|uniref:Zn(2)-C6 fungal-type domain-containing protein n=1 Tax=Aplosporella prunicola CBS 121167 TaxID=1176127 RepID=A0A6A6BU68_9PEZI|nr:uncharacterized protein K452DRAFT_6401 [Aplosporella prunicola CBS 121167]KAF2147368.1 hypothetical protein K452DRAFT_6401 [Aplosporella prunicola CBS 121167]
MEATARRHKKSRNGCIQCKKRRVKCDEQRPCNHCARHGVECSLTLPDAPAPPHQQQSSSSASRDSRSPIVPVTQPGSVSPLTRPWAWQPPGSAPQHDYDSRWPSITSLPSSTEHSSERSSRHETPVTTWIANHTAGPQDHNPFDMLSKTIIERDITSRFVEHVPVTDWHRDLELLHHYSTYTYQTLSELDALRDVYQNVYGHIGYKSKPVMHGILGVAALHLAHLRPDARAKYLVISTNHQNRAISEFRLALPKITAENCDEIYTLSSLTTILRCANLPLPSDPNQPSPVDDTVETFMLMRGVHEVLRSAWSWIAAGPLLPALVPGRGGPQLPFNTTECLALDDFGLQPRIDALWPVAQHESFEPAIRKTLEYTIADLTICMHRILTQPHDREPGLVLIWPIRISPECIFLIRQHHPGALVMLAHWCIILHNHSNFWWLGDRGRRVVHSIWDTIDPMWHDALAWPMQYVNDDANSGKLTII